MFLNTIKSKLVLFSALLLTPIFAQTADIPVALPSSGAETSVSPSFGLNATGNYATGAGQKLNFIWNITQTGSTYHYVYNISYVGLPPFATTAPQIQTFILGLSPTITNANVGSAITNLSQSIAALQTFTPSASIDLNGLPSSIYGMGFVFTPSGGINNRTLSFDSTSAPIWGNAYASNIVVNPAGPSEPPSNVYIGDILPSTGIATTGGGTYTTGAPATFLFGGGASTAMFGTTPTASTTDFNGWIPIPGAFVVPVPEPTTMLLLSSALATIYLKTRSRRETA
jgi:hypothetical protein